MNNRKWLAVLIIISMMVAFFPAMGFAETNNNNGCDNCETSKVVDLIAGQNQVLGTVMVTNDNDQLCVTYALDADAIKKGWKIYETHLYVGDEYFEGVLTKSNQKLGGSYQANPIPGKFPYGDDELKGVLEWTKCIPLEELGVEFCDEVYIAAHAVVKRFDRNATSATIYGNIGGYEEGQGDIWSINPLERIEEKIFTHPGGNFEANWYPNALAYDMENNRLYFSTTRNTLMFYDFTSDNDISALTNADPNDFFSNSNNVLGATFGDGSYWYSLNQSGKLYRVDFNEQGIATNREEYVMTNTAITQGDLVYENGMIYGSSGTGASGLYGFRGFFSYDTNNDEFEILYTGDSSFAAPQLAYGLDEDGNKVLYGSIGGDTQNMAIINLETGEMTEVTISDDSHDPWITENRYQDLASSINYAETWESQTAWGDGNRFNDRGNWGMWFKHKICEPGPECVEVCADFCTLAPGASVEGLGTVEEYLNIQTPDGGNAVKVAQGEEPAVYGAPNISQSIINGGVCEEKGGFSDLAAKNAGIAHNYTFTFAEDTWVTEFSLRMLDFGDYNPTKSTHHYASMTAYNREGEEVDKMELEYTSDGLVNPRYSNLYGDLYISGDAITAAEGEPGNWIWSVSGENIVRIELEFGVGFDPNIAFDKLCFTICK